MCESNWRPNVSKDYLSFAVLVVSIWLIPCVTWKVLTYFWPINGDEDE